MKRMRNIGLLVTALLMGLVVIYVLFPSEPGYQGKRLTKWLEHYYVTYGSQTTRMKQLRPKEHEAVDAIGAKAIPTLLSLLRARNSSIKMRFIVFWSQHRFPKVDFPMDADSQRKMGAIGFAILGKEAHAAIPALIKLTNDDDPHVQYAAMLCLNTIEPDAQTFLPVLAQRLKDEDAVVHYQAAVILSDRFPQEAERLGVYQVFPHLKPVPGKTNVSSNLSNDGEMNSRKPKTGFVE